MTDTQTPPLPAPGEPHAYVAVRRTHSPHADRPEWSHRAYVIPAWDDEEIDNAMRCADTLLPIGPDGDTGTRWVTEPHHIESPEELDALPVGSVVLDNFAAGCTRVHPDPVVGWVRATDAHPDRRHFHPPYLPARVLFDPTQEGPTHA